MLLASIDIGSNAVRLLFANVFPVDEQIHVEKATLVRIPVRLGMDVFDKQKIGKKRADDLVMTLQAYRLLIDVYKPVDYVACATSAIREASNGKELIRRVREGTGIKVRIIDGIEEANIIRSMERPYFDITGQRMFYVDVGGGSTDISIVENDQLIAVQSFKLGTIRLLEKKDKESEWQAMANWLGSFRNHSHGTICIGTGGNINKINKLYGDPFTKILQVDRLRYAYDFLGSYTLEERITKLGMRTDRADVIIPAARIFLEVLKAIDGTRIYVPKLGLADGLVMNLYKQLTHGNI